MMKAQTCRALEVALPNETELLHAVTKAVAEKGINILAVTAWTAGMETVIRLVTDDNLRAGDALRARGYAVREPEVVLVELPHRPGMLESLASKLWKAGVQIHHLTATGLVGQEKTLMVLGTSDNQRAVVALNV